MAEMIPNPTYDMPKALKGFEMINRYWDKSRGIWGAKIMPGQYYVTISDEIVTTVLGSCIAACIRDKKLGIGGMNHFMLPVSGEDSIELGKSTDAARYGNYAMEHLVNEILKNGGRRENLEVKVFGGGKILKNMTDIGKRNIEFVHQYIQAEGMKLIAEDTGEVYPRKVVYHPASGKANVKRLRSMHNDTLVTRERDYMQDINQKPVQGDIELF
ncbi:MAG: chemoreceptor glutamine deamidase CheD [Gammaproteobacteria bacterium]|nr:chemoreceptor glutamine deamidase CheD [Gammaproteobacteria bacterium]